MNKGNHKFRLRIGMRNIKTAISATLCALVYYFIDRDPTFACIGAVFGMGSDMGDSWLNGGNRLFGTIIGGVIGMVLYRIYMIIYPDGDPQHLLMMLFIFVGVVILILASQLFKWPGAIQPGGVILCIILFTKTGANYIPYSLNRMLDTGVGVIVSLLINLVITRERVNAALHFLKLRKKEQVTKE